MTSEIVPRHRRAKLGIRIVWAALLVAPLTAPAQSPWERLANRPDALDLESGYTELETDRWHLKLVTATQTVAELAPKSDSDFDFTPGGMLETRKGDGLYHLGDLTLRLRERGSGDWRSVSTAAERAPVDALDADGSVLAAADLANTLPDDLPLRVERYWETSGDDLVLRFRLTNTSDRPVEIGSLGIPMIFNNILHGQSLDEAHANSVFYDPYIGCDAGYVQVVRLHGGGPVLLVTPHGENTPFEAYNPLTDDPTPRGVTFEGFYEWMAHSRAHAETDWSGADPWNSPTSALLDPGESRSYGVALVLADSIRDVEPALRAREHPVAVGVPGYVLPMDVEAKLFLGHTHAVRSFDVEPAGALEIVPGDPSENGWETVRVRGREWGRARLTVTYEDGARQSVHYKVIKPEAEVVGDLGRFLTTEQWFDDPEDPFGRAPSVISYDYDRKAQVTEDGRAWIAGLSDEGGAGSWLAAVMKQSVLADPGEVEKLRRFVDETLWEGIQYGEGERRYGVRKSLFFYEPDEMPEGTYSDDINYGSWSAWDREEAESTGRSYNYPHVAAAHWVMYRLARYHNGLVPSESWRTSLERAGRTALAMREQARYYSQFGQMEGTVFLRILEDLQREDMTDLAQSVEDVMRDRADVWRSLNYPFGSEMPWDSTGQEEVYAWSRYFGYDEKAQITLDAILAYMPTVPHWGYNGSARRYWDFVYAGKLTRIERQLHHYGSGLNAIPVLTEFRDNPDDFHLLRTGHAGSLGPLANITREGFAPAAFHAFPDTLRIDGYSGDYGPGFLGYALNSGTYVTRHAEFGWLPFGGNLGENDDWQHVTPTTASRSRVYLAPFGLWLTLDAGRMERVEWNAESGEVRVHLEPADDHTPEAFLRVEQPARIDGVGSFAPENAWEQTRGAFRIPLREGETVTVRLRQE